MSLLSKFIDSFSARLDLAAFREVAVPFNFAGSFSDRNVLVQLNKGWLHLDGEKKPIAPGEFIFIPQAHSVDIKFGKRKKEIGESVSGFANDDERRKYLKDLSGLKSWDNANEIITTISFELLLYNAFPFFPLMNLEPFRIPYDEEFSYLVRHIALESEQEKLGKKIILNNYVQEMIIHLFRYMNTQPKFQACCEQLDYLTDRRLIDIVSYIQKNLGKDLSNKAIADVAFISEDYVGQFFKSLTKRNLQDYIENQRLEKAMEFLKTMPDNVQEISIKVGFKDPAYFSRRFKMKFGINANEVKKQKNYAV
jgi:AraC family transcriptional regulator of arabinose operon